MSAADFVDGAARVVTEGPCVYFADGPCPGPSFVGGAAAAQGPPCKFTYIDKLGRTISQVRFGFGRDFSEGLAPVRIEKLWGFIDKGGAFVVPPKFDDAQPHSSGLAKIREHGLYGYVDKVGSVAIPARYKHAEDFSEGLAVVGDENDHLWYIDQHGDQAIRGDFAAASPFFNGLAHVRLRDEAGARAHFEYIDAKGRRIFTY